MTIGETLMAEGETPMAEETPMPEGETPMPEGDMNARHHPETPMAKERHQWQKETHQCPKTDMNARHYPDGPNGRHSCSACVCREEGERCVCWGGGGVADRREIASACVCVSHTI